jgi:hypothetical protein
MDDAFTFRAPAEALRRRVDPRAVRLALVAAALLATVATFGRWVAASERASVRALAEALAAEAAAPATSPVAAPVLDDAAARDAATEAMAIARERFEAAASFAAAGTAALSAEAPDLIFVDGPSVAASIVSVEARRDAWAAAVMGPSGACYWVRASAEGLVRYGTGADCTGEAALAAEALAW